MTHVPPAREPELVAHDRAGGCGKRRESDGQATAGAIEGSARRLTGQGQLQADHLPGRGFGVVLDTRLFLLATLSCIAALVVAGVVVAYLGYGRAAGLPEVVLRAFLLDDEANFPTFFAFSLLVLCSVLLALIGGDALLARRAFRFRWALLAAVFMLLAFDEAAHVHERFISPLRTAFGATGWLYFAWIIPASVIVAVMGLFYLPFLRSLPAHCRWLFVLAGALYVGGAIGVEMPGGAYYEAHGKFNVPYQLITTCEETLEMLGLAVFAYALMRYLGRGSRSVRIGVWPG